MPGYFKGTRDPALHHGWILRFIHWPPRYRLSRIKRILAALTVGRLSRIIPVVTDSIRMKRREQDEVDGKPAVVSGDDPCRPTLCALGTAPHAHCPCGLAMAATATLCDLCRSEGLLPLPLKLTDHEIEWDGHRYPSRRLHRPADIPPARYDDLLQAIFAPDEWRETQKERRRAA